MRQWRVKRKLAHITQNQPLNAPNGAILGVTGTKTTSRINENCDTSISPEKKFFNIHMFHPIKKNHIHLIECFGKTIVFLKSQGFEEKKNKFHSGNL